MRGFLARHTANQSIVRQEYGSDQRGERNRSTIPAVHPRGHSAKAPEWPFIVFFGAELKRCAIELGFPGIVIASEVQGQPLDAPSLRPFWWAAADLGLYVFIHPPPQLIGWAYMDADDLWRMLGWEFSLMVATVRLINSGLLDELPAFYDLRGPQLR